jgi:hypothetical protein
MRDNYQPVTSRSRPVQIKEIAVLQFQALSLISNMQPPAQKHGKDRLEVPIPEQERRMKLGSEDRHIQLSAKISPAKARDTVLAYRRAGVAACCGIGVARRPVMRNLTNSQVASPDDSIPK